MKCKNQREYLASMEKVQGRKGRGRW